MAFRKTRNQVLPTSLHHLWCPVLELLAQEYDCGPRLEREALADWLRFTVSHDILPGGQVRVDDAIPVALRKLDVSRLPVRVRGDVHRLVSAFALDLELLELPVISRSRNAGAQTR